MLKIDFTNEELNAIKSKIHFTPLQERIISYRQNEYSITKMSTLENCSESTINREIKKIKRKIIRVI
jgi:transposase-like protein